MVFIGSGGLKEVLFIKIKYRHDGFSDQFSRIFMTKMFIISAFVMSIDFFSDRVSCWITTTHLSEEFIHAACWIQGFYVYKELIPEYSAYYGMPGSVTLDGYKHEYDPSTFQRKDEYVLCSTESNFKTSSGGDKHCTPFTKVYYMQYQYLSFYVASLAVLYYLPYLMFRLLNADLINLKDSISVDEINKTSVNKITDNYFNYESNGGVLMLRVKVLFNLAIKIVYVIVNVGCFLFTDHIMNDNFMNYGLEWIKWSATKKANYGVKAGYPKPGNVLLPTMGFCELTEGSASREQQRMNNHKLMCEISTHILYQYVLLVIWFLFVAGIFVSAMGLIIHIGVNIFTSLRCIMPKRNKRCAFYNACKKLTLREIEYMKYIRMKNLPLYNAILRNLLTETGV